MLCDSIDNKHWLRGCVKISLVGNSCNAKNLVEKKMIYFPDFLENGVEFWCSACAGFLEIGAFMEWLQKLRRFPQNFSTRGR